MQTHQVKRKRSTLKDAHDYFKHGSYSVDPNEHFLSGAERENEIKSAVDDLQDIVKKHFPRTNILEYAILKAHLIIERALLQYIRGYASVFVDPTEVRFSFSQKLEVAYLLGFGANHPSLLPTIEGINRIRNQVAHAFCIDRIRIDEILRINHEEYDTLVIENDRQRIAMLRSLCIFICGYICGTMQAHYFMAVKDAEYAQESRNKRAENRRLTPSSPRPDRP